MYGYLRQPSPEPGPPASSRAHPPPMSMAPPPPGEFKTREALLDFQKEWAEKQGFAVVIGRSRKNRLWIKCDRGGEYSDKHLHDPENRKRRRKETRLTGCPFIVKSTQKKDGIWRCQTETGEHNHGPSEDLSIHPSLRRMTDAQIQMVNQMTEAGNTPVETLEELQRIWPGIKVLRRDIYNARKKYKTEREAADVAEGLHLPRPFEDPNGKMPGPTLTGRWEWIEDGDEIKRKKKRKLSTPGQVAVSHVSTPNQLHLAPELRDTASPAAPPSTARRQAAGLGTLPARPFQQALPSPAAHRPQANMSALEPSPTHNGAINGVRSPPAPQYHYSPLPTSTTSSTHPNGPVSGPPRSSYRTSQPPPMASAVVESSLPHVMHPSPNPNVNANPGSMEASAISMSRAALSSPQPSGSEQILISRLQRVEKDQRDTKNMLVQILGAISSGKQAQGPSNPGVVGQGGRR